MSSASVRLYKSNPSTGAYDAHEGGSRLGCVVMGSGLQFQILVYNGQKAPQATVPLSSSFAYNVRDLYMSFADGQGSNWSILFDAQETMMSFLRVVVACVAHVSMHTDCNAQVKGTLSSSSAASEEQPLATGMAAGIYYTAWEMGDLSDYPSDIVAAAPCMRVAAPSDVAKIK